MCLNSAPSLFSISSSSINLIFFLCLCLSLSFSLPPCRLSFCRSVFCIAFNFPQSFFYKGERRTRIPHTDFESYAAQQHHCHQIFSISTASFFFSVGNNSRSVLYFLSLRISILLHFILLYCSSEPWSAKVHLRISKKYEWENIPSWLSSAVCYMWELRTMSSPDSLDVVQV